MLPVAFPTTGGGGILAGYQLEIVWLIFLAKAQKHKKKKLFAPWRL